MRMLGFVLVFLACVATCLFNFHSAWNSPKWLSGLVDTASLIGVLGPVIGGVLIAYGSELGVAFKTTPTQKEAITAISVYKLAVRISIGSGFICTLIGWIAMLGHMGGAGMDIAALTGGTATSLITSLYGLVYAFCLFLPLQYYFQYQLDKDS